MKTTKQKTQKIIGIDSNAKTRKGLAFNYTTAIVYLSPSKKSGKNLCAHSSKGCEAACLDTAGRGAMESVQKARLKKTHFFLTDREAFVSQFKGEIKNFAKNAAKKKKTPCVRPNGTSDVPWYNIGNVMQDFPTIQFYDYTPNLSRMVQFLKGELPKNYHLTFSRKEDNDTACYYVLANGGNVAMVFDEIPSTYNGFEVVNGDESDLRFLDKKGVIVGLKAKGKALKDTSGFVIKI
jgi:hypothetical protein